MGLIQVIMELKFYPYIFGNRGLITSKIIIIIIVFQSMKETNQLKKFSPLFYITLRSIIESLVALPFTSLMLKG